MFNKFMDQFDEQLAQGNISDELLAAINNRIGNMPKPKGKKVRPFPEEHEYNITDPWFRELVDTYDRRGAIAEMLKGQGVGGKTKGRSVDVEGLLAQHLEPSAADVPNWSIGDRLVKLDKKIGYRPDLHQAYPWVNYGEDLGVKYKHAPAEIALRDFNQNIRDTLGRDPMQIDWRTKNPTQFIDEDYLKYLQMHGYKAGGMVDSLPEEAISNTVRDPGAAKMLNMDLAKLALLRQQPKRMAKGGRAEVREIGIDPNHKKVTERNPELTLAAQLVAAGKMPREEYWRLADKLKPVKPYDFVPKPASAERVTSALKEPQRERYGTGSIPEGRKVGLRLDIPAYSNHGVWVNSVHDEEDKGKAYYEPVSHITDAVFDRFENKALNVASGTAKAPFARITGNWKPIHQDEAVERAQEYLAHPEWRQVGMDPTRRGHFYDRESMQPIHSAAEVIQIGPLVLAKNPIYGKQEEYSYAKGGKIK